MSEMETAVDWSRRSFLRGRAATRLPMPLRPPWALEESAFLAACTRCDACVAACATQIVVRGAGGFPEVDFTRGECTFCNACADNCRPQALVRTGERPWRLAPAIAPTCLAAANVVCRSCGDVCEARAIRFRPRLGGAALPEVDASSCTGCGACVRACPSQAVTMQKEIQPMENLR